MGAIAGGVYYLTQDRSGEWIAYETWESDGTRSLWVVRPDGEDPIEVVSGVEQIRYRYVQTREQQSKYTPFAPKGSRMLFTASDGNGQSLYTYALGKEKAERIVRRAESVSYRYSPDGARIAVQVQEKGESRLFVMDIDGGNEVCLLDGVEGSLGSDWLPSGRLLVVLLWDSDRGEYSLLLMDDQGEGQVTLVDDVEGLRYRVPPEGDRIAYAVQEDGEWDVYVADADGSEPTWLEGGLADVELAGFSPDGKHLLVKTSSDGDYYDLYLLETDGSDQVTLARDIGDGEARFCPGGKRIWYADAEDGYGSLYLADTGGGYENLIERRIDDLAAVDFTPDGRTMVVSLESGGNWDLYAADVATGGLVELMSRVDDLGSPVVMDDKRVLFSARDGDDWSLYIARLDGGESLELAGPVDWFMGYDASPDGRRIVYSEMGSRGTRLYVIDADGENRERLADEGVSPVWSD